MPGFGDSPFGDFPFGKWPWSRQVLWDFLPEIYKSQDAEANGDLEKFQESLRPSLDFHANKISTLSDLRDPLRAESQYTQLRRIRLGKIIVPNIPVQQRGVDGVINGTFQFRSPTARFTAQDVGRTITFSQATQSSNNRAFLIATVLNYTTITLDPVPLVDVGPFRWEVKDTAKADESITTIEVRGGRISDVTDGWNLQDATAQLQIVGRRQFFLDTTDVQHLTFQEGDDGQALADGRFQRTAAFKQSDVGRVITVSGSSNDFNNVRAEILDVDPTAPNIVDLSLPITIVGAANGSVSYNPKAGTSGITIEHANDGGTKTLLVTVTELSIRVRLATTAGTATSTANQVVAAVAAHPGAFALVTGTASGTGLGLAGTALPTLIDGVSLIQDPGPLHWALLKYGELDISGQVIPAGAITQEGVDLQITNPDIVSSVTVRFAYTGNPLVSTDIGKILSIRGSLAGNNVDAVIKTVTSLTTATVVTPPNLTTETLSPGLTWVLRIPSTLVTDPTHVELSSPGQLQYLSEDFGVVLDKQHSEFRQRLTVQSIPKWIDLKGTKESYQIQGDIAGYHGETTITNASITTVVSGTVTLTVPTSVFTADMVGGHVTISGAASANNNGTFAITNFYSGTSIGYLNLLGVASDANNPNINGLVTSSIIVDEMYRVNLDIYNQILTIDPSFTTRVAEVPLVTYTDGRLLTGLPKFTFYSVTALFTAADIGKGIKITNAFAPALNSIYTISTIIDSHTVTCQESDISGAVFPDNGTGGTALAPTLNWTLVGLGRLLTGLPRFTFYSTSAMFTGSDMGRNLLLSNRRVDRTVVNISAAALGVVTVTNLASMTASDVGGLITISGAATAGNNGTFLITTFINAASVSYANPTGVFPDANSGSITASYSRLLTIDTIIDSNTVSCLESDDGTGTFPEEGVGGIPTIPKMRWQVVRLYSTKAPLRARFDDINTELMESIINDPTPTVFPRFQMDDFCWDPHFIARFYVSIKSVSPVAAPGVPTTYTIRVAPPAAFSFATPTLGVVASIGQWRIVDKNGVTFALEAQPASSTADNGASANITAVAGPLVTVTGLTGMTAASVGTTLTLSGAASLTNNGTFTIAAFISAVSVQITNPAGVAPDANNGTIAWIQHVIYTTQVFGTQAPVIDTGAGAGNRAELQYICPTVLSCDYCKSYRVRLKFYGGPSASEAPFATVNALDRVLTRIRDEAKPIHAEVIVG